MIITTSFIEALGEGTIHGHVLIDGKEKRLDLQRVLYVPKCSGRFISTQMLDSKGFAQLFADSKCQITQNGKVVAVGVRRSDRLYYLYVKIAEYDRKSKVLFPCVHHAYAVKLPAELWHERLGHLNWEAIRHFVESYGSKVPAPFDRKSQGPCAACTKGKKHRGHFPASPSRATQPFDLIHSDLSGPMDTPSVGKGNLYMGTYIDDCTGFVWVQFYRHKSEQEQGFKNFHAMVKVQFGCDIKRFRSD